VMLVFLSPTVRPVTYVPALVPPPLRSLLSLPLRPTPFPYTTLFRSPPGPSCSPTGGSPRRGAARYRWGSRRPARPRGTGRRLPRSEEHTSELQSRFDLVCRLLRQKKKISTITNTPLKSTYTSTTS